MSKAYRREIEANIRSAGTLRTEDAHLKAEDIVVIYTPRRLVEAGKKLRDQSCGSRDHSSADFAQAG